MKRAITCGFRTDLISEISDHLVGNFLEEGRDLSRVAVVFGGRRPALFLGRELARRVGRSFFPPRLFSMDEFVRYLLSEREPCSVIPELEACHLIYKLCREMRPEIVRGRESFSLFLPWAREISSFITQLDLEDAGDAALRGVQLGAGIGYDVPDSVNTLLETIAALRGRYHSAMTGLGAYSRGFIYLRASRCVGDVGLGEFKKILFCNVFHLHATERSIIKKILDRGQAELFIQCDDMGRWPTLQELARDMEIDIRPPSASEAPPRISLSAGFDAHSQAALVREIVKEEGSPGETVIVLPDPGAVIPLLSELSPLVSDLNVSMGYPVTRTPLYSLLRGIWRAQAGRKGNRYNARDYLAVLGHPLLKNMMIIIDPMVTRVLVHRLEEILGGAVQTPLAGSLFVSLEDVESLGEIPRLTAEALLEAGIQIDPREIPSVLKTLHSVAFRSWENVRTCGECGAALENLLSALVRTGSKRLHLLTLKVAERILRIAWELGSASFRDERGDQGEIFAIVHDRIAREMISFSGAPLKGLQVLGLFETRSLTFKNVVIMDLNESVLPALRVCEPLIPRQVMLALGLNRVEREEEIQRYHFARLIGGAEKAHLVYDDSPDRERSRFIEEIVWEDQVRRKLLGREKVRRAAFRTEVAPPRKPVEKSPRIMTLLENLTFSPSRLDAYLECPLKFYYGSVLKLRERESLLEEPEGADVGEFIHSLLQGTFGRFLGARPRIDAGFRNEFMAEMERSFSERFSGRMASEAFLTEYVLRHTMERFLDSEASRGVRQILSLEKRFDDAMEIRGRNVPFTCRVDRIDRLEDGAVLILDYKTGGADLTPRGGAILGMSDFSRNAVRSRMRSFQIPLYLISVKRRYEEEDVRAGLYYLRKSAIVEFPGRREKGMMGEILSKCEESVRSIVGEILDPAVPFGADEEDARVCEWCPYSAACT